MNIALVAPQAVTIVDTASKRHDAPNNDSGFADILNAAAAKSDSCCECAHGGAATSQRKPEKICAAKAPEAPVAADSQSTPPSNTTDLTGACAHSTKKVDGDDDKPLGQMLIRAILSGRRGHCSGDDAQADCAEAGEINIQNLLQLILRRLEGMPAIPTEPAVPTTDADAACATDATECTGIDARPAASPAAQIVTGLLNRLSRAAKAPIPALSDQPLVEPAASPVTQAVAEVLEMLLNSPELARAHDDRQMVAAVAAALEKLAAQSKLPQATAKSEDNSSDISRDAPRQTTSEVSNNTNARIAMTSVDGAGRSSGLADPTKFLPQDLVERVVVTTRHGDGAGNDIPIPLIDNAALHATANDGQPGFGETRGRASGALVGGNVIETAIETNPADKASSFATTLAHDSRAPKIAPTGIENLAPQPSSAMSAAMPTPIGETNATTAMARAHTAAQAPADQVALHIVRAAADGIDRFRIEMHPSDLGRVEVKLEVGHDGRVIAMFAADRQDTLDLLQRDARVLERALLEAGLKADANSLNFNLRGHGREADDSRPFNAANDASGDTDSELQVDRANALAAYRRPASGRLDIRV